MGKKFGQLFFKYFESKDHKKCIKLKITRLALIPKYNEKAL